MFVDYYYDYETERPEYIECNPRVGETVNAWLCGVNLCEQLVQVSKGEPAPPLALAVPGMKTQSFFMILLSMAYRGASRWELVREFAQFRFHRGMYAGSQDELTRLGDDYLSVLPLWWIALQLIASPGRAKKIVAKTIEDYSLPESSTKAIDTLDVEPFRKLFSTGLSSDELT
ncbi:MAG: hypothetical protein ACR2NU_04725, partial [Aeoliella sp.]